MKNVNLDKIVEFIHKTKENPDLLKRDICAEVKWNMNEDQSQVCYSCFSSTFAVVCKEIGTNIKSPSVVAKNRLNLSSMFGIANEKVTDGVEFEIVVSSDKEKIEQAKNIVVSRYPAIWCMQNFILVTAKLSLK